MGALQPGGGADMVVTALTQTFERSRVVDFSIPLLPDRTSFIAPAAQHPEVKPYLYLDIFHEDAWAAQTTVILVLVGAFVVLHRCDFVSIFAKLTTTGPISTGMVSAKMTSPPIEVTSTSRPAW